MFRQQGNRILFNCSAMLKNKSKTTFTSSSKRHASTSAFLKANKLALGVFGTIFLSGSLYYGFNSRSAIHEYVVCPLVRLFTPDAEDGHKVGIWCFKVGLTPWLYFDKDDASLEVNVFGKKLTNPLCCAAGLDKDADGLDAILNLGFGAHEVGSVTPKPQDGNARPRFFRLPDDDAVINRYGFNSKGHEYLIASLKKRVNKFFKKNNIDPEFLNEKDIETLKNTNLSLNDKKFLQINLGKNKTGNEYEDYLKGVENFQKFSDVLVINVSSPNTPGLRDLQNESKLTNLLTAIVDKRNSQVSQGSALLPVKNEHKPPVLVKIAPDLSEVELKSIVQSAKTANVDGIIVSNTTIQRPVDLKSKESLKTETGGLSGKPLKPIALKALRIVAQEAQGSNLVLVGCGGISSGKDCIEFAKAGATYVQLYTAFAYTGPPLVARIKDELTAELKKEGKTWMEIIGEDLKKEK
ncbi:Dihydroorotate dehydrogenase (quinone), mitochondrial [Hanseniaspora valbyensis]